MLWVTYYGNGILAKVDPAAMKVVKEYPMPAGSGGGPYAVAVDGAGRVWANEIDTDTVALFDPKTRNSASSSFRRPAWASARRSSMPKGASGTWAATTASWA
jgi:streptogramin lyase